MAMKGAPSSHKLDQDEIAIVKGMLKRGDKQHDIAAWFGVNGGRIAEISTGATGSATRAAAPADLPPAGPYPAGREAVAAKKILRQIVDMATVALERIEDWERRRIR